MRTKTRKRNNVRIQEVNSIENSFSREFMERVVAEMPADLEYVVQEKVHGANTSFLCDREWVRFAKRTPLQEEGEKFYDCPELLCRYHDRVVALTKDVMAVQSTDFLGTTNIYLLHNYNSSELLFFLIIFATKSKHWFWLFITEFRFYFRLGKMFISD